jgi:hypothetical protein
MWSDRKPWWVKKAKDNKVDKTHWKNWCVVEVMVWTNTNSNGGFMGYMRNEYKACAKLNAPKYYTAQGVIESPIAVDNLTKQEAYEVAKGLNFLDGETNGNE